MNCILTNDDGIDAPGIRGLIEALKSHKIAIAAPKKQHSGCGHQVTTHRLIHVERRSDKEYAIGGTPADCVRIGLSHLFPEATWVISGINAGGNMGIDVYISGTVAAVREAVLLGRRGIAISQYRKGKRPVDWPATTRRAAYVLADLLDRPLEPGSFWNVNLPYVEPGEPDPEIVFCQPSTQPLPIKYRVEGDAFYYIGDYGQRDRAPNTDVDVCFSGKIAVTQIKL